MSEDAGEPTILDEAKLWDELMQVDPHRKRDAMLALDALAQLAAIRTEMNGTGINVELGRVFSEAQMQRDLQRDEGDPLFEAADRALEWVSRVTINLRVASADQLAWAESVAADLQEKIREKRVRLGFLPALRKEKAHA